MIEVRYRQDSIPFYTVDGVRVPCADQDVHLFIVEHGSDIFAYGFKESIAEAVYLPEKNEMPLMVAKAFCDSYGGDVSEVSELCRIAMIEA